MKKSYKLRLYLAVFSLRLSCVHFLRNRARKVKEMMAEETTLFSILSFFPLEENRPNLELKGWIDLPNHKELVTEARECMLKIVVISTTLSIQKECTESDENRSEKQDETRRDTDDSRRQEDKT
jgi:hypothetical protein